MSTLLFGRRVVVQLGTTDGGVARQYDALRIGFDIKMQNGSKPNTGKIEVYNTVPEAVALMQSKTAVVRLFAGYATQGGTDRLLFQGNPIKNGVKLEFRDRDRVLMIEASDGGREYSAAHVATSFSTGTTSRQAFQLLADAMGLPLGNVDAVIGDVSFPSGLAINGPVSDALDRIAVMSGARWQIRDGTLQFWAADGSTGENAVVFSTDAGNLIGSPTVTDKGVEVTALLAPTLRPGKPFRVQSAQVNGDFVATDVQFKGDSGFDRSFYVIAKGRPL